MAFYQSYSILRWTINSWCQFQGNKEEKTPSLFTWEKARGFEKNSKCKQNRKGPNSYLGSQVFFTIAKENAARYISNCEMQKLHCGNETVKEFLPAVDTDSSNYLHYDI